MIFHVMPLFNSNKRIDKVQCHVLSLLLLNLIPNEILADTHSKIKFQHKMYCVQVPNCFCQRNLPEYLEILGDSLEPHLYSNIELTWILCFQIDSKTNNKKTDEKLLSIWLAFGDYFKSFFFRCSESILSATFDFVERKRHFPVSITITEKSIWMKHPVKVSDFSVCSKETTRWTVSGIKFP